MVIVIAIHQPFPVIPSQVTRSSQVPESSRAVAPRHLRGESRTIRDRRRTGPYRSGREDRAEETQPMSELHVDTRTVAATDAGALRISVRLGRGTGPTRLAAFDAALRAAGVADRNLLILSSIIPAGTTVERAPGAADCPGDFGDRLYVVMADARVERPHEEAWAGIAWCQDPATSEGLFVEHSGHSEHQVRSDLESSLESIAAARGRDWGAHELAITGITCEDEPVCALAVACYQHDPWRRGDVIDLREP